MHRIEIKEGWCKGCCICVEICPHAVFGTGKAVSKRGTLVVRVTNPNACTGCMECELLCPDLAITVTKVSKVQEVEDAVSED